MSLISPADVEAGVRSLMAGYFRMIKEPAPTDDPKAFGQFHTACRTALAHVEYLIKVSNALAPADAPPDLMRLIDQASRALDLAKDTPDGEDPA